MKWRHRCRCATLAISHRQCRKLCTHTWLIHLPTCATRRTSRSPMVSQRSLPRSCEHNLKEVVFPRECLTLLPGCQICMVPLPVSRVCRRIICKVTLLRTYPRRVYPLRVCANPARPPTNGRRSNSNSNRFPRRLQEVPMVDFPLSPIPSSLSILLRSSATLISSRTLSGRSETTRSSCCRGAMA